MLQGDVRAMLATLPADSVHCVITSVPYWGLRAYGTEPQVWGGAEGCAHVWGDRIVLDQRESTSGHDDGTVRRRQDAQGRHHKGGQFCSRCKAWRGEHGQEPTPALYVAHEVEIWRALRRVLRPDGVAWLNIGDTYQAGQGGRQSAVGELPKTHRQRGARARKRDDVDVSSWGERDQTIGHYPSRDSGLKPKDLCLIPERLAIALQDSGWWIRSRVPWCKRSAMPDSANDRPGVAVEYFWKMTKRARYFWDAAAVRQEAKYPDGPNAPDKIKSPYGQGFTRKADKQRGHGRRHAGFNDRWDQMTRAEQQANGRNFRDADLLFQSLAPPHGLISDAEGNPLALDVNTAGFSAAHFATFPPKLIDPLIKASTSERGCCPACGAPWVRVTETTRSRSEVAPTTLKGKARADGISYRPNSQETGGVAGNATTRTLDWRPSCACPAAESVPCTVLDCFGGAGTTGLVADRLGRDAVLIELQPDYAEMARRRIAGDAGLFAEVT